MGNLSRTMRIFYDSRSEASTESLCTYSISPSHRNLVNTENSEEGKTLLDTSWEAAFDLAESTLFDKIMCPVCYEHTFHSVTLECGHTHCRNCTVELIEFYISSNIIHEKNMKCPSCGDSVRINRIRQLIPRETLRRLGDLRKKANIARLVLADQAVWCPSAGCVGFAMITEEGPLSCHKCKISICKGCLCVAHVNMTCEEFSQEFCDEAGQQLASLIIKLKWKQCPYCKFYVEKIDGCNHMECCSVVCAGDNGFCYLCGKGLSHLDDQYSHFGDWGPSNSMCKTLGGIEEA